MAKASNEDLKRSLELLQRRLGEFIERVSSSLDSGDVSFIEHVQATAVPSEDAPSLEMANVLRVHRDSGPALYLAFGEIVPRKSAAN